VREIPRVAAHQADVTAVLVGHRAKSVTFLLVDPAVAMEGIGYKRACVRTTVRSDRLPVLPVRAELRGIDRVRDTCAAVACHPDAATLHAGIEVTTAAVLL
jgi:hypothetical protein